MTRTAGFDEKPRYTTKRLRQEIERARQNDQRRIAVLETQLAAARKRAYALEDRIAELERALAPFAKVADVYDKHPMESFRRNHTDDTPIYSWFPAYCDGVTITIGDARHAARILKGTEDG